MDKLFQVNIITAQEKVFEGSISSLVVPAELGYLGVLANHAGMMANLVPGKITYREGSGKESAIFSEGKGFLEVRNNKAILLLDEVKIP